MKTNYFLKPNANDSRRIFSSNTYFQPSGDLKLIDLFASKYLKAHNLNIDMWTYRLLFFNVNLVQQQ